MVLSTSHSVPWNTVRYLRPYQREGVVWMYERLMRDGGCILADDMGLGKTPQTIALLSVLLGKTGVEKVDRVRIAARHRIPAPAARDAIESFTPFEENEAWRWERVGTGTAAPGAIPIRPSSAGADWTPEAALTNPLACAPDAALPVLILAPLAVLKNWQKELDTWGYFDYVVLNDFSSAAKQELLADFRHEILISTPRTALEMGDALLRSRVWGLIIMDEAHMFKNSATKGFVAIQQVPCRARLALTGTPYQNDLKELHNVLAVALPESVYHWSTSSFNIHFAVPIAAVMKRERTQGQEALAEKRARELRDNVVARHILQRMKSSVLADQLPKKHEHVVFCKLSPVQERAYRRALKSRDFLAMLNNTLDTSAPLWAALHKPKGGEPCCRGCPRLCMMMACMAKLLKIANHLELIKPKQDPSDPDRVEADREFAAEILDGDADLVGGIETTNNFATLRSTEICGKLGVLERILAHFYRRKEKVLIFSRHVQALKVLIAFLRTQYQFEVYTGEMDSKAREEATYRFLNNPDVFVMLVSLKAGGVGLNLTAASVVIIFDPDWNPANDAQAQDRAYRIGQTRDVTVFRLLSIGTIEEMTYLRQVFKLQTAQRTISDVAAVRFLNREDVSGLEAIFDYKPASLAKQVFSMYAAARSRAPAASPSARSDDEAADARTGSVHAPAMPSLAPDEDLELRQWGNAGDNFMVPDIVSAAVRQDVSDHPPDLLQRAIEHLDAPPPQEAAGEAELDDDEAMKGLANDLLGEMNADKLPADILGCDDVVGNVLAHGALLRESAGERRDIEQAFQRFQDADFAGVVSDELRAGPVFARARLSRAGRKRRRFDNVMEAAVDDDIPRVAVKYAAMAPALQLANGTMGQRAPRDAGSAAQRGGNDVIDLVESDADDASQLRVIKQEALVIKQQALADVKPAGAALVPAKVEAGTEKAAGEMGVVGGSHAGGAVGDVPHASDDVSIPHNMRPTLPIINQGPHDPGLPMQMEQPAASAPLTTAPQAEAQEPRERAPVAREPRQAATPESRERSPVARAAASYESMDDVDELLQQLLADVPPPSRPAPAPRTATPKQVARGADGADAVSLAADPVRAAEPRAAHSADPQPGAAEPGLPDVPRHSAQDLPLPAADAPEPAAGAADTGAHGMPPVRLSMD